MTGSLRRRVLSSVDSRVLIPEKIEAPRGGYPNGESPEKAFPPLIDQAEKSVHGLVRLVVGKANCEPVQIVDGLTMMMP
jgi:hypothetical protein